MANTPRWGHPYPEGTDAPDVPLWMLNLATSLDDVAKDDQGLLANRPVSTPAQPGKVGRYYYATDTDNLYRDYGTGWTQLGPNLPAAGDLTGRMTAPKVRVPAIAGTGYAVGVGGGTGYYVALPLGSITVQQGSPAPTTNNVSFFAAEAGVYLISATARSVRGVYIVAHGSTMGNSADRPGGDMETITGARFLPAGGQVYVVGRGNDVPSNTGQLYEFSMVKIG